MTNGYEKTILQLIERVTTLEERIKVLEVNQQGSDNDVKEENIKKVGTQFNKDALIKEVKHTVKSLSIDVQKASIADGGGVITKYENNEPKKVMLRRSRNYAAEGYEWRGWHTIKLDDIDVFDGFILSIENNGKLDFFVFSKNDFMKVLKQKQTDTNDIYHFYFNKTEAGTITDDRENEIINMQDYYSNWGALQE